MYLIIEVLCANVYLTNCAIIYCYHDDNSVGSLAYFHDYNLYDLSPGAVRLTYSTPVADRGIYLYSAAS